MDASLVTKLVAASLPDFHKIAILVDEVDDISILKFCPRPIEGRRARLLAAHRFVMGLSFGRKFRLLGNPPAPFTQEGRSGLRRCSVVERETGGEAIASADIGSK